jgi:hypothetical protein
MLDQHPVFMALAAPRRRELLDNEPFVALGERRGSALKTSPRAALCQYFPGCST